MSNYTTIHLIEQIKVPAVCLHFHRCGNIQEKVKKDRNASDDYAGAAMGASITEVVVVPPAVTVSRLVLYGGVAGWHLWPTLPFTSFLSPAVLFVRAPGSLATLRRRIAPLPPSCSAVHLLHQVIAAASALSGSASSPPGRACSLVP